MPVVAAPRLRAIGEALLAAAGAPADEVATVFRQGHIGRLASYPLLAVEAGMIDLIAADSGCSPKNVALFGGPGSAGRPSSHSAGALLWQCRRVNES